VRVGTGEWRTIVGVAADVKYARIDETPRPYLYVPFFQSYRSAMVLHTRGANTQHLVERARAHVASLDPDLPIINARPMTDALRGAFFLYELAAFLLLVFGLSGIALAALGTYGLVSYAVKQSTREIGIRMALGATGRLILQVFLARGLRLGAIGAAIGVAGALLIARAIRGVLYGVSATDAMSFAAALAAVLAIVTIATLVPAWRASRTNPLVALRHQ
jgi:ABC-type antimicrobial peptide transport system permease subunit